MTLKELYDKVPSDKQSQIRVIDHTVVYDDGVNIYIYCLDGEVLVPTTVDARNFLNSLS